jgi:glutamyl-tRNA synthetase
MSIGEQEKEYKKIKEKISERETRVGLPEIPNSENGVTMRFAPAPSGPLHLGHVIGTLISSLFVKKYGGKFYVRIEDTNPEKIDKNAYEGIKDICNWLFDNVHEYIIQSERMQIYYKYAEELIEKNYAYICTCSQENFKKIAEEKKDGPCRNLSIGEIKKDGKKCLM